MQVSVRRSRYPCSYPYSPHRPHPKAHRHEPARLPHKTQSDTGQGESKSDSSSATAVIDTVTPARLRTLIGGLAYVMETRNLTLSTRHSRTKAAVTEQEDRDVLSTTPHVLQCWGSVATLLAIRSAYDARATARLAVCVLCHSPHRASGRRQWLLQTATGGFSGRHLAAQRLLLDLVPAPVRHLVGLTAKLEACSTSSHPWLRQRCRRPSHDRLHVLQPSFC